MRKFHPRGGRDVSTAGSYTGWGGVNKHFPSFCLCHLQVLEKVGWGATASLLAVFDCWFIDGAQGQGLNKSQRPVLVNCGETKGSTSSDIHTHTHTHRAEGLYCAMTKRSISSVLLTHTNMHTRTEEPQALAVNTQASHKMHCKYLQLGRRWREKNMEDQAALAKRDRPQPTASSPPCISTPSIPHCLWPSPDLKSTGRTTLPYSAPVHCGLPWLTLWQLGRSPQLSVGPEATSWK